MVCLFIREVGLEDDEVDGDEVYSCIGRESDQRGRRYHPDVRSNRADWMSRRTERKTQRWTDHDPDPDPDLQETDSSTRNTGRT
jgi:hypothetical protein